jgi:hypothetical protein
MKFPNELLHIIISDVLALGTYVHSLVLALWLHSEYRVANVLLCILNQLLTTIICNIFS